MEAAGSRVKHHRLEAFVPAILARGRGRRFERFWPKLVLDHNTSADQIYWPRTRARGALRFPAILLDDTCQYL
jgi:hypothetical protein